MLVNFNGHFVSAETYNLMATLVAMALRNPAGHGAGSQRSHVSHAPVAKAFMGYAPAAQRQGAIPALNLSSVPVSW